MKKYEEEHYRYEKIKDCIYPWVKEELRDSKALNGKNISEKDTPVIAFAGDLKIIFAIKRGEESYEILKDNMLPPDTDMELLYHTACENLARNVKFVIGHTLYGGFSIIADGYHEASSLCFKHIWSMCSEKLDDDIVIMVPTKDMVLFVPAGNQKQIEEMKAYGIQSFERSFDKVSTKLLRFTKEGKELTVYE